MYSLREKGLAEIKRVIALRKFPFEENIYVGEEARLIYLLEDAIRALDEYRMDAREKGAH